MSTILARYRQALGRSAAPATESPAAVDYGSIYAVGSAGYGTAEDLRACEWAEQHGHPDVIQTLTQLEQRAEDLALKNAPEANYKHAVEQLVHLFEAVRAAYAARHEPDAEAAAPAPRDAWRIVIEETTLRPGPIRLADGCTTITDPVRCIEQNMVDLERAIAHRNAGQSTAYTDLIDQYLARLAACGCKVRVGPIQ